MAAAALAVLVCAAAGSQQPQLSAPQIGAATGQQRAPPVGAAITCPPAHFLGAVRLAGHIMGFSKVCPSLAACCSEAQKLGATSFTYNMNSSHTPLDPDCRFFGKLEAAKRWDWNCTGCISAASNLSSAAASAAQTRAKTDDVELPPLNKPTLPHYKQTWDMQRSTIIMPCNKTGPLDPAFFGQFGVVDVDWSNNKYAWANQHPMNSSGLMLEQAISIHKTSQVGTKVWAYRNLVKALPWITAVRKKLEDPAYSGWFLSFDAEKLASNGTSMKPCDLNRPNPKPLCSTLYHDQQETPEFVPGGNDTNTDLCKGVCDCGSVIPCGEYVFDHRNASLRKWLLEEYIGGPEGIGAEAISGIFIDDRWTIRGPSEIDGHCVSDVGLSASDVQAMIAAWALNMAAVQQYIIQQVHHPSLQHSL